MMLKWLANIVVVLGCGYIGVVLASRIDTRIRQLKALESVFGQLAFNIGFLALPFPEALHRAAQSQRGVIRELIAEIANVMREKPELSPDKVFEFIIPHIGGRLCIGEEEIELIREFLAYAGRGDSQNTMDGIRLTLAKLRISVDEAENQRQRDGKLYRGLGFMAGLLIVVILF